MTQCDDRGMLLHYPWPPKGALAQTIETDWSQFWNPTMARIRGDNHAFGWPGLVPCWTHGDKDGIGTAYSAASRIWFTVWNGIVTEVYYPTVDTPQMRDVQLLFTDGQSFFHQETRYLETHIQRMPSCLGYRVEGKDRSEERRV